MECIKTIGSVLFDLFLCFRADKVVKSLSSFKSLIKTKPLNITIDNFQDKMNYKVTTVILLMASILVTTEEFIGEHIKCLSDKGVENRVLNTFCFFTTTFTVVSHDLQFYLLLNAFNQFIRDGVNLIRCVGLVFLRFWKFSA